MSMLRTLVARGSRNVGDVTFLHYARSQADIIFRGELERLAREAPPNLRIHVEVGPFDAHAFAARVPDFDRRETWACGPEPFVGALKDAFAARDAEARVRVERFSLVPASSASSARSTACATTRARSRVSSGAW
jgi:stearoyl-CoA 9-desaturase NADPH oxidoreductase